MGSIIFILILGYVSYKAYYRFKSIYDNIMIGREEVIQGDKSQRWKNVILIAFGQKKMFKNFIPAVFHLFIYVAFLFTQIELIEIIIDGVFGTHRVAYHLLGGFYTIIIWFIEILSVLALIATFVFLWRRNILRVPRLVMDELNGWPKIDANVILFLEILLVIGIFSMNGADGLLQKLDAKHYPDIGTLPISPMVGALLDGIPKEGLYFIERFGWWLHVLVVFVFILYLPLSKHLHIFLSFPNVYFASLTQRGEMKNMPIVMNEVKSMMGLPLPADYSPPSDDDMKFGAKDVNDISWKNILDAYSCTECGRCTSQCPANITGKKLSPRKIMMDVRDRATEVGHLLSKNPSMSKSGFDDGKSLFNYITREEVRACTTCNACVEACPVMINPLDIILQLRRYEVLTESNPPEEWTPMFTSLENNGAVWQVSTSRTDWIN